MKINMKTTRLNKLFAAIKAGRKRLDKMAPVEKKELEKIWDIEHAYFSSSLEGSKVSKEEFSRLAKKIA